MKQNESLKDQVTLSDKAATGIANGILKIQGLFASSLKQLTNKWKKQHQFIFLYAVCFLFGGLSIAAIINSFKVGKNVKAFMPASISVPNKIYKNNAFVITDMEFKKVQEYKRMHPNLIKERPGLFESLTLIEHTYYSQ